MTRLDKPVIMATVSDGDDPWFIEPGVAVTSLEGLYVWEESTSVTITHLWTNTDRTAARISWVSTNPDARFWVYIDGVLKLESSLVTFLDVTLEQLEGFIIQVFDSADHNQQAGFPVRFTLGWFAVDNTARYKIEELISAVWTERGPITDRGEGFFTFLSRPLEDDTTHQFRITPVGDNGNDGTILTFSTLMVRVPDPPDVSMVYNGAGTPTVTITAN